MPDNSEALEQNLAELAAQCGIPESVRGGLANLAGLAPDELQKRIAEIEKGAQGNLNRGRHFNQEGNEFLADLNMASAEEAAKAAAVLELIHEAKVSGQPVDQKELLARLQSFKTASDNRGAVLQPAELLFQAEINAAIGPELIEMGFSAEEVAVVVKAIADYSLENDQMEPTVENAEKIAGVALENLKNNHFIHQQPGISQSEFRIQSAAQRCLGMKFVKGQDGNLVVARPDAARPLNQDALNDKIGAAKVHVYENGAHAVIGERAQRAGENVKRDLNNRPKVPPAEQRQIQLRHSDPSKMTADSPEKHQELQLEADKLVAKMDDLKQKNPGLKQLDSNKVGVAIHGKERNADKIPVNKLH
jgi:hypothetical protein